MDVPPQSKMSLIREICETTFYVLLLYFLLLLYFYPLCVIIPALEALSWVLAQLNI